VVALVAAALLLLFADWKLGVLGPGRAVLADAAVPFYQLASLPLRVSEWSAEVFGKRDELIAENRALRAEALVLRARSQRLAALAAENLRLRELLNSTALLEENVLVAEVIGVSPDPGALSMVIDKGTRDGLHPGLAVIDAFGLFGQIVESSRFSSRVLLLTDATHAVPAQVLRNGVRVIVEGNGRIDSLDVNHVAPTMDVRPGDLLVSSGLGQRFPGGYPVGVVESVNNDPGRPFAAVAARPSAQLDRSRHVLVLTDNRDPAPAREPAAPVAPDAAPAAEPAS
jgi:rod shape-determining protein MreC